VDDSRDENEWKRLFRLVVGGAYASTDCPEESRGIKGEKTSAKTR
jgi:hypothetical protein